MTPDDELDPSDWLAAQFGEEPPAPKPVAPEPTPPPAAPQPATPSYQPPPVNAPPPFTPPPIVAPVLPAYPPVPPQYPAANPSDPSAGSWQLSEEPAASEPAAGGFSWGLTPGTDPAPHAHGLPAPPVNAPPPFTPPPIVDQPPTAFPPVDQPPAYQQPGTPFPAYGGQPAAFPVYGEQPTTAFPPLGEQPTAALPGLGQQFPGAALEPTAPDPSQWLAAPIDPALDGVTEVFEAELVGLTGPQGEGLGASAIDDLFGDGQFRDFSGEPLIAPLPPRQGGGSGGRGGKPPRAPRAPIPRNQKILMWIAGGLVAALALVALFAIGMKLSSLAPAPAITPSPTPSASSIPLVLALGPVKPGDYHWDQLLGGECLKPFQSAWQDDYTVVECTAAHPAQLVYRGVFTDPASATYPGLEELQKRINLLCTPATIINYGIAGTVNDIQVTASFAADEDEWDAGNHSYFCFVSRSSGADLTASVAVPQVAPVPTATPTSAATPGAPVGRGHATGTKP